ncbi:MAG: hypothetical protein E6G56_03840 [Actinobacteria bacterium]|nr:MAG: hypothetical protein E6G56_03840 [Actinomycetota bacterium]
MSSTPRQLALALAGVTVLALSACGGTSDKDQIINLIRDVGKHPQSLCTKYATPALLAAAGGQPRCLRAASAPDAVDTNVQILSVNVTGSTASATVQGKTGRIDVKFIKENGSWKVTNPGG